MTSKIIIDTNRLIAALIRDSVSRKIIYHADIDFFAIPFALKEIEKHWLVIKQKAELSDAQLDFVFNEITERIVFIDDNLIEPYTKEADEIIGDVDKDDVPFIAAALALGADIWSDDWHFQKQKKIKIWRTGELVNIL